MMENRTEAIRTEILTKKYGDKTAVNDLDLTVYEGELFSLLGVNGAGKTTTIRMLTCLSAPTSGSAKILGHDVVKEQEAVKKIVGVSTQDTAVAEKLTVKENLRFMAEIYDRSPEAADSVIETFGLEEVADKKAKTLSGGWKRRLSIAMAVIGEPKILFLDEPTLGLDVLARRELWKIIERLKKNTTIILTTHYMEEAQMLSDRIGIMLNGRLVRCATLKELQEETGKSELEEAFIQIAETEDTYHE